MSDLSSISNERLPPSEFAAFDVPRMYDELGLDYEELNYDDPGRLQSVNWVISQLHTIPPPKSHSSSSPYYILDIGCASGRPTCLQLTSSPLTPPPQRPVHIHGIDISPGQIALARQLVPDATFEVADLRTWTPEISSLNTDQSQQQPTLQTGGIDVIISFYTLNHLPYQQVLAAITSFSTWLRPGGLLALGTVANVNGRVKFMGYDVILTAMQIEEIRSLLEERGFTVEKSWEEDFWSQGSKGGRRKVDQIFWCRKRGEEK